MTRSYAIRSVRGSRASGNPGAAPPLVDVRGVLRAVAERWPGVVRRTAAGVAAAAHGAAWRLGASDGAIAAVESVIAGGMGRFGGKRAWTLRVGIDAPADLASGVMSASSGIEIEWASVPGDGADAPSFRRMGLDAIVRARGDGSVQITTPEHENRPAAWYDWGSAIPLTFASVFPLRVDPARVTITGVDAADGGEMALLRAVIDAAAATSRHPARLMLADRIAGRAGTEDGGPTIGHGAMARLADLLVATGAMRAMAIGGGRSSGGLALRRTAMSVASAWAAGCVLPIDPDVREGLAQEAMVQLPDRPEALLRAGAERVARYEDGAATEVFLRAARLIRSGGGGLVDAGLEFIQSEMETGGTDPRSLGRLAAGVTLACAALPRERIAFVREDVLDDLRHSGWLIGRDQDRAMLSVLLAALEKAAGEAPFRAASSADAYRAASAHTLTSIFGRAVPDAA